MAAAYEHDDGVVESGVNLYTEKFLLQVRLFINKDHYKKYDEIFYKALESIKIPNQHKVTAIPPVIFPSAPDLNTSKNQRKIIAKDGDYEKYASGIVFNKINKLEWYAGPDKDITWDEAKLWIESLNYKANGWRFPNTNELKTLFREGQGMRNMTPLINTTGWIVWSVEEENGRHAYPIGVTAFCMDFNDGTVSSCIRHFIYIKDRRVLAVRGQKNNS